MTIESKASSSKKAAPKEAPATAPSTSPGGIKQAITPAERWLMIRDSAYVRAQKRGFVGGNPFEDWLEAEREVDAKYATDFGGLFALTDPVEITEQFKSVFAGYGLGHLSVDALLDEHREGMEKLAAFNSKLIDSTSELASQQTALFQDAVSEAVKTLQSVARGRVSTDGIAKHAELSTKAVENTLSLFKTLTESMTGMTPTPRKKGDSGK